MGGDPYVSGENFCLQLRINEGRTNIVQEFFEKSHISGHFIVSTEYVCVEANCICHAATSNLALLYSDHWSFQGTTVKKADNST